MKQKWNERYKISEYCYGKKPNDFLKENIFHFKKNCKILSLCEGEGRNAVFLAKSGFKVEDIDFSEEAYNTKSHL